MLKIETNNFNELFEDAMELDIITYLEGLVLKDIDESGTCDAKLEPAQKNSPLYLWELQCRAIERLNGLLSEYKFTK